jgi:DNA-binding MarR family transcriptional regulator
MCLHIDSWLGQALAGTMIIVNRRGISLTSPPDRERLSPCVCSTLRMVSRVVTQLYDTVLRPSGLRVTQVSILATIARMGEANLRQLEDALAIDQTTLTRSLNLLERDGVIERVPHPDARVKAMRLTSKGRRTLKVARPLWAQAQEQVLREFGMKAWADAQRRLGRLLDVAVTRWGRRRVPPSSARRRRTLNDASAQSGELGAAGRFSRQIRRSR